MTSQEISLKAEREKNKGNEAFYAGDHNEAIIYYNRSLSLQPTAATYNNRAMAYIKLKKWDEALEDCNRVLEDDTENVKAMLRRGVVYQGKRKWHEALADLKDVLEWEPHNKRAQTVLAEVEKEMEKDAEEANAKKRKGRKLVIEEVDCEEEENTDKQETNTDLVNGHADDILDQADGQTCSNTKTAPPSEKEPIYASNASKVVASKSDDLEKAVPPSAVEKQDGGEADDGSDTASESPATESENISESSTPDRDVESDESDNEDDDMPGLENDAVPMVTDADDETEAMPALDQEEMPTLERAQKKSKQQKNRSRKNVRDSEILPGLKLQQTQTPVAKDTTTTTPIVEEVKRTVFVLSELPDSVTFLKSGGNELYKSGQYADAIERYSKAINKLENVKDVDHRVQLSYLYSNRAACTLKTGASSECIADCTKSLQLLPHSIKPLIRRAQAYETKENYKHAYVDYKQVLAIDPSVESAVTGSSRCGQHLFSDIGTRWREHLPPISVVTATDIPLIVDPKSPQATQLTPEVPRITAPVANPITEIQQPVKSVEEVFMEHKNKGAEHVKKSEFDQAADCYTECIHLFPRRAVSFTNRALCYLRTNKPDLVVADCDRALELEPENVKAYFRRAQAKKMLKDYLSSLNDLTKLLKIDPKNAPAKTELANVKTLYKQELDTMQTKNQSNAPQTAKKMESKPQLKPQSKPVDKPRKRVIIEEVNDDDEDEKKDVENEKSEKSKDDKKPPASNKQKQTSKSPPPDDVSKSAKNTSKTQTKTLNEKETKSTKPKIDDSKTEQKSTEKGNQQANTTKAEVKIAESEKSADKSETMTTTATTTAPLSKSAKKRMKKKAAAAAAANDAKPAAPSVPQLTKMTPYEFMQAWNSLKSSASVEQYSALLDQIQPTDLAKLLSNKLDGDMLSMIIKSIHQQTNKDVQRTYELLSNLTKVARFPMVSMFMADDDKKRVREITSKLPSKYDSVSLKKTYGLKV
ncbi:sperm-associated antigen 1-like isoform X2 [Tubulanus polymorphus]